MARDVYNDPEARSEMAALGFDAVPVAVLGELRLAILHADQLREMLGLPAEAPPGSYQELVAALNRVLEAVEEAVLLLPAEHISTPTPNRGRDIRELAYNIHYPVRVMAVSLDSGLFEWRTEKDFAKSRRFTAPAELVAFCREIRQNWQKRARLVGEEDAQNYTETLKDAFSNLQILESQAWHAAQHLRQIYVFLRAIGVEPAHEMTAEEMTPIHLGDTVF